MENSLLFFHFYAWFACFFFIFSLSGIAITVKQPHHIIARIVLRILAETSNRWFLSIFFTIAWLISNCSKFIRKHCWVLFVWQFIMRTHKLCIKPKRIYYCISTTTHMHTCECWLVGGTVFIILSIHSIFVNSFVSDCIQTSITDWHINPGRCTWKACLFHCATFLCSFNVYNQSAKTIELFNNWISHLNGTTCHSIRMLFHSIRMQL